MPLERGIHGSFFSNNTGVDRCVPEILGNSGRKKRNEGESYGIIYGVVSNGSRSGDGCVCGVCL